MRSSSAARPRSRVAAIRACRPAALCSAPAASSARSSSGSSAATVVVSETSAGKLRIGMRPKSGSVPASAMNVSGRGFPRLGTHGTSVSRNNSASISSNSASSPWPRCIGWLDGMLTKRAFAIDVRDAEAARRARRAARPSPHRRRWRTSRSPESLPVAMRRAISLRRDRGLRERRRQARPAPPRSTSAPSRISRPALRAAKSDRSVRTAQPVRCRTRGRRPARR